MGAGFDVFTDDLQLQIACSGMRDLGLGNVGHLKISVVHLGRNLSHNPRVLVVTGILPIIQHNGSCDAHG